MSKTDVNIMSRPRTVVSGLIEKQIAEYRSSDYLDFSVDPRSNFNLDGTKIAHHADRVKAWMNGERVAPITIDMALTQKCSYACTFCYAGLQQNPASPARWEHYEQFLDDCTVIGHKPGEGVKAISLVSDGESTENPYFLDFILKAKRNNIDIASGTNGLKLPMDRAADLVESLTYLRININAAEPRPYAQVMGTVEKNYYKVLENIRELVRLKQDLNSDITIGLQMVLLPEYADQVLPLAKLGRELGVDYTVIKHCSDDEDGRLGVDYSWYLSDEATSLLKTAEAMSTSKYSVQAKWSKLRTGRNRKYSKCFGTALLLQMSGTGIVAPCGSFFSQKYKRFHIGDIKEQPFREIWASDSYWEVMSFLGSEHFDPRKECATLCLQDKVNEVLFDLVENNNILSISELSKGDLPHRNFI